MRFRHFLKVTGRVVAAAGAGVVLAMPLLAAESDYEEKLEREIERAEQDLERQMERYEEDFERQIEQSIEQARGQLDAAARRLAELHTRKWDYENSGPRAERPMLGVLLGDAATSEGLPLAGVTPGGGAERAGLKGGDVLVSVNGVSLAVEGGNHMDPWREAMGPVSAGDDVEVVYLRDGEVRSTQVQTMARSHYMTRMMAEKEHWIESLNSLAELENLEALENLEKIGALSSIEDFDKSAKVMKVPSAIRLEDVEGTLAGYFGVDAGVLVLAAGAAAVPLQAGDVLLDLEGRPVTDSMDALSLLAHAEGPVSARILRHGQSESLTLNANALNADRSVLVVRGNQRIRIYKRDASAAATDLDVVVEDD